MNPVKTEYVTFANIQYAKICGYKFYDLDFNGTWDMGEPVIPDWEIELYVWNETLGDWEFIATTTTNETGQYCFEDLDPRFNYTVIEVIPAQGWVNTTALSYEITDLMSGDTRNATFGNIVCVPGHTIGFWKNNARKHLEGDLKGFQVPKADYLMYLANITEKYGDDFEWLNFSDVMCPTDQDKLEKAYAILSIPDASNMTMKAQAQILSLLLTVELYGYTDEMVIIPDMGWGDGAFVGTISEAVVQKLEWYSNGNYSWAQAAADYLNNIECDCYWIYNGEEENSTELSTPISPVAFGAAVGSVPTLMSLVALMVGLFFISLMAVYARRRR